VEPEGSLLHPKVSAIHCLCLRFYVEELLAPRPTTKPEDHTLSAVRDCLFSYSIYPQLPSILEAVPPSATWGHAVLWWQRRMYHGDTLRTRMSVALRASDIWSGFQEACHLENDCTAKRRYYSAIF